MKWRYGIFKLFSIFFNFLLARVSLAVSFQPLDKIQLSNSNFFFLFWELFAWKKNLGLFGPFSLFSLFYFFFNFWFFQFFKYSTMSKNLATLCIWKVTSRLLIWPLFESNFVVMKWRYGIFKFFSIFFNFLLARVSQAVSFQPLNRIQFSNAHFFSFCFENLLREIKLGVFALSAFFAFLGLFGPFYLFSLFFF